MENYSKMNKTIIKGLLILTVVAISISTFSGCSFRVLPPEDVVSSPNLATDARYYFNGDVTAGFLRFDIGGGFTMEGEDGSCWSGTYTIEGDTISADLDGDIALFQIADNYTLEMEDGYVFIRIPEQ